MIRIPFSDITGACFEVHLGGQAIAQIDLASERICTVLVPLDKARGDDVTLGVDGFFALDCILGDGDNLPIFYPNIAHTIKVGLGVHHPAVVDHDIVIGSHCWYDHHLG